MNGGKFALRGRPALEASMAFTASAAFFLLTAAIPIRGHVVAIVLLGAVYVYVVLVAARRRGPSLAVPLAIAGGLAFDSFYIPPTRQFGANDWQNWLVMAIYISMGVLVGMLAGGSQRRAEALADEHAALRRVATLIARAAPPAEVLAAVAQEAGRLLSAHSTRLLRYDPDNAITILAGWHSTGEPAAIGQRETLGGRNVSTLVFETGRPARLDKCGDDGRAAPAAALAAGMRSCVGAPISADGRLWGAMIVVSGADPPPADIEARLTAFTELVATVIANTQAREQLRAIADEQAALRRVATLVARAVPPADVFAAVAEEVGRLLCADVALLARFAPQDAMIIVAAWCPTGESSVPLGPRRPLTGQSVSAVVRQTGRTARVDEYSGSARTHAFDLGIRSAVGAPITVDGRLWGVVSVATGAEKPAPPDAESRLADFTELVATAIANTQAREELSTLADEQAALRRVATLVAGAAQPPAVFKAVAEEVGRLLPADRAFVVRYDGDESAAIVGAWTAAGDIVPLGEPYRFGPRSASTLVRDTGGPIRIDEHASEPDSPLATVDIRSLVAAPIVVEDRLWGLIGVASAGEESPPPPGTEERLAGFTELIATAIANAQAGAELAASRARIVAAADDERRRVVRDLHDGAQQRLVHTIITLKLADHALGNGEIDLPALLTEARENAEQANVELRELAHGILPGALNRGGLRAGIDALAAQTPVPVEIDVPVGRLPAAIEATAYFVVAEALTNIAKHARAHHVAVSARIEDGALRIDVRDDGVGGARPDGSGLVGLGDRLAVLDGRLRVESPATGGTLVVADIPLPE